MDLIKKILILIIISITLIYIQFILLWVYKIITVKKGVNDCMITYIQELYKNNLIVWYWYKTPYFYHISSEKIDNYGILLGRVKGCNFWNKNNIIISISNTIYCKLSYSVKN